MREHHILNPTLLGVEEADVLVLIGTNPRHEAPVWNARIRKAWLWNNLEVGVIGPDVDLSYDHARLGDGPQAIASLLLQDNDFVRALKSARRPMVVVGEGALCREDGAAVLAAAHRLALDVGAIADGWAGFGVLHNAAGRVGALDVGFVPGAGGRDTAAILSAARGGEVETLFLLGVDEIDLDGIERAFTIYVGHHGDRGAAKADVILPCTAYTEMTATYVNTEGRVQRTRQAVGPKGDAREGWAIFRALSERVGRTLAYDSADALRGRLAVELPVFAGLNFAPGASGAEALTAPIAGQGLLSSAPFQPVFNDFYLTNPVARASKTMAECSLLARGGLVTPVAAE